MKILYFSRDLTVHDERFLAALARTGNQIYFLRLEISGNENGEVPIPRGVETIPWVGGRTKYSNDQAERFLPDLKRVIDQVQPDLIQAGPLHLCAYLAARSSFKPLVSMSWGYDLLYEAPRNEQVRQAIRYTLENSTAMVGDCNTIRKLAISYGLPDERIVTFPWGIDLSIFTPTMQEIQATDDNPQSFTLLSTRGWEPIYGTEEIAHAFVQAAKLRPELRLVMLGSGSQAALIRQILNDGKVLDKVTFPGQVKQADLPGIYCASNLYISASHSDGTSISLLEALACGKPALVSDIPGNREWIEPGVQGWLYPEGNIEALASGILNAIEQRNKLSGMGQAARQLAEQRADWNMNFPQLFKAYEIALNYKVPASSAKAISR